MKANHHATVLDKIIKRIIVIVMDNAHEVEKPKEVEGRITRQFKTNTVERALEIAGLHGVTVHKLPGGNTTLGRQWIEIIPGTGDLASFLTLLNTVESHED